MQVTLTRARKLLPLREAQVEDGFTQPSQVRASVPAQTRHKGAVIRKTKLCGRPGDFGELFRRNLIGNVADDGVVQPDDRSGIPRRGGAGAALLALSGNPATELATQAGLDELRQRAAAKRDGWRRAAQEPS